jgi:uncharacterized protein (DUF1778 family)
MQMQPAESDIFRLSFKSEAERLLLLAAKAAGRPRSNFGPEGALSRCAASSPDRKDFGLDADRWAAFVAALDAAPRELPRVLQLLHEPRLFDPSEIRQVPR